MPRYAFEQFVHLITSAGQPYSAEAAERAAKSLRPELFLENAKSLSTLLFGETAPDKNRVRRFGALLLAYFPSETETEPAEGVLIQFYSTDLPGASMEVSTRPLDTANITDERIVVLHESDPSRHMTAQWNSGFATIGGQPLAEHYPPINRTTE